MRVNTCVQVSVSNIMQEIFPSGRCEPFKMSDLDDTTKSNGVVVDPSLQI